LKSKLK